MKVVPLVSGGIDSSVLMYRELLTKGNEVFPFAVNYGQKNIEQEKDALRKVFEILVDKCDDRTMNKLAPIRFMDVTACRHIFRSGLTSPDIQIPNHDQPVNGQDPSFVPFRNFLLISLGLAYADLIDAKIVLIGSHKSFDPDYHAPHSDSTAEFIDEFAKVVVMGNKKNIRLLAPFSRVVKEEVIKMGSILGVPLELTYGCYRTGKNPCGKCPACFERIRAFKSAGIEDKTKYGDNCNCGKHTNH